MPAERPPPEAASELLESFRSTREAQAPETSAITDWVGLVESDARYRHVLEQMRAMLIEIDTNGRVADVSSTVDKITGFPRDEFIGQTAMFSVHEDDLEEVGKLRDNLRGSGAPAAAVFRFRHKNGDWIWLETASVKAFRAPDGSAHAVALTRDVSDVKRAADELRASEERYRLVSELTADLITEADETGGVTFASPNSEALIGYPVDELTGDKAYTVVHPDDRERVEASVQATIDEKSTVEMAPYRVIRPDGSEVWLTSRGISYQRADGEARFLSVTRDITRAIHEVRERRELEEHMRRAQRLESLGILAGGIAHDFNNLLTPVLGEAGLALMDLPKDSPARIRLERVQDAAQRAAALTNQMLAYAGEQPLEIEPIDVSELVREMLPLLESAVSGKNQITYDLDPALPRVDADPSRLRQVVMNLVTNAAEAVGDGAGSIHVHTGTFTIDGETPLQPFVGEPLSTGDHVVIEVRDTGAGMDDATRARIFDPFFSTKFTGRGLGLAAALGIVRSHNGAILVESELGKGTRARVALPIAAENRDTDS